MPFREFDIVVYGATGYTGQLICQWLAEHSGGAKWAAAGRNEKKILSVLRDLGREKQPFIVADSTNPADLEAMVKRTQLVIAAAGPFSEYGAEVVKACANNGVHYFDVTGEPTFVNDCIQKHAQESLKHRTILVNCAGFDSVPSDLGVYLAAKQLGSGNVGKTRSMFVLKGDGVSGGTFQTIIGLSEQPRAVSKALFSNPYVLSPKRGPQKKNVRPFAAHIQGYWGGFWPMSVINQLIVQRSWGILETEPKSDKKEPFTYGPEFEYYEAWAVGGGFVGSFFVTLFMIIGTVFLLIPGLSKLVKSIGPQPGAGAAADKLDKMRFKVITEAKSADGSRVAVVEQRSRTSAYRATAIYAVEAALAVLKSHDSLPLTARAGGPLTVSTATGDVLVERLKKTGYFEFEVKLNESKKNK